MSLINPEESGGKERSNQHFTDWIICSEMKIIGVIPARYESSRFPGKPLADICGKPMIWWVYQQCKKVEEFSEIYVATDSHLIVDECKKYNMNVLLTSSEHQTGTDRLGEVARSIDADFYVNVQGDEPLIEPEVIKRIIDYKIDNRDVEIINTMTMIKKEDDVTSNTVVKVVSSENNDLIYLSRSPIPYPKKGQAIKYYKHLGLYGLTKRALDSFAKTSRTKNEKIEDIEMLRFLETGYSIKILPVESKSIGVDRIEDIEKVSVIIKEVIL